MARNERPPPAPWGWGSARSSRSSRSSMRGRGGRISQQGPTDEPRKAAFTLAEEARQTSQQDHSTWGQNSKLRSKPVPFLSAGQSEPLKHVPRCPPGHQRDGGDEQQHGRPSGGNVTDVVGAGEIDNDVHEAAQGQDGSDGKESTPPFFIDLAGRKPDGNLHKASAYVPARHSSPETSPSDEEVILFRGRNKRNNCQTSRSVDMISIIQVHAEAPVAQQRKPEKLQPQEMPLTANPNSRGWDRRGRRGRGRSQGNTSDDSILDDYIANMRENGDLDESICCYTHRQQSDEPLSWLDKPKGGGGGGGRRGDSDVGTGSEAAGEAPVQTTDDADCQGDGTESVVDDETLARLIAGQNLGSEPALVRDDPPRSDSDSTSDAGPGRRDNDVDLVDWERPSVRKKKGKGSRAQMTFDDGFDAELVQQMQAAWKNDRLQKKQRKEQREALRALGLLGQKAKPDDLRVKYPTGMSIEEVAEELRDFLTGVDETLSYPPMDLHARKVVHELANQFKVNSKSTGKAEQRRTTLYRTGRTLPYVASTFEKAVARIRRRYLPRSDVKGKLGTSKTPPARGSNTTASYRDGEVVGAAAPELGTENRGRAMLEKMGWSRGTALGAAHNKGILQPVTQTMKRSKAGLG